MTAATAVWAADPFVGTWKFDAANSELATGRPIGAPESFRLEAEGDDLQQTIEVPDQNGRARKHIMHMKLDGKEYPSSGNSSTVASKRVNLSTFQVTSRSNGKVWQEQRWAVSPDGKTLTIIALIVDAKTGQRNEVRALFDRQ
jgi:hypothetical protein